MIKNKSSLNYNFENSYEKFIKKHLQHYGYYQGNNIVLRELEGYDKYHGYSPSDESTTGSDNNTKINERIVDSMNMKTTQVIYDYFEDGSCIRKLKAPHNYVLNLQESPRWPIEMEVLPEGIHHINTLPPHRELVYISNGCEIKPQPKGDEIGKLVYEYKTYSGPFFTKSKTISKETKDLRHIAVNLESEFDETLCFESRFESGNLEKVYQISPYEYELYLRPDLYTSKHTQWYYFRVSNTRANKMYRFTIVNLYKADSLYNEGLRPLLYSEKDARISNKGWRRCGINIAYYKNNLKYTTKKGEQNFYSLTWNFSPPHDQDTIYFSHCYPYTYSNLMKYIDNVSKDPFKNKICRIKLLTRTLADNISLLLTITNFPSKEEEKSPKKIVVLTGRVHPGETNASWMMEGLLDFLLSNKPDAILLRDMFIFKIVPMLNPDGVIVGNYRCSLSGRDLNRNYKSKLKDFYPIIYSIRNLIDKFVKEREILLYCDFHGHSKKQNIFVYGCNDQKDENEFLLERAFPFLLSKNAADKFDYRSCSFKMQKSKSGTSRIAFRNIGILHSFTLEASFCGPNLSTVHGSDTTSQYYHFNTDDLKLMGEAFCYSLLDFCDPDKTQINIITAKIKDDLTKKYTNQMLSKGIVIDSNKLASINLADLDIEEKSSDDDGSDSSDSDGLPSRIEYVNQIKRQKKIKQKENKELKDQMKESEIENTCLHLLNSRSTPIKNITDGKMKPVRFPENHKRKFKTPSPKIELQDNDEKEKTLILPRCSTNNCIKKNSSFLSEDSSSKPYHEVEATKIELSYSGVSKYRSDNYPDYPCPFHKSDALKERDKKMKQFSNVQVWKPSGNIADQILLQKPYKLKNLSRPKSGLATNTFQILSFNSLCDTNYKQKLGQQKTLNPIKKGQTIPSVKNESASSEENKSSNIKSVSFFSII